MFYPVVFSPPIGVGGSYLYNEAEVNSITSSLVLKTMMLTLSSTEKQIMRAVQAARFSKSLSHPRTQHFTLSRTTSQFRPFKYPLTIAVIARTPLLSLAFCLITPQTHPTPDLRKQYNTIEQVVLCSLSMAIIIQGHSARTNRLFRCLFPQTSIRNSLHA